MYLITKSEYHDVIGTTSKVEVRVPHYTLHLKRLGKKEHSVKLENEK